MDMFDDIEQQMIKHLVLYPTDAARLKEQWKTKGPILTLPDPPTGPSEKFAEATWNADVAVHDSIRYGSPPSCPRSGLTIPFTAVVGADKGGDGTIHGGACETVRGDRGV